MALGPRPGPPALGAKEERAGLLAAPGEQVGASRGPALTSVDRAALASWIDQVATFAALGRRRVRVQLATPSLGALALEVRVEGRRVGVRVSGGQGAVARLAGEAEALEEALRGRSWELGDFLLDVCAEGRV